MGISKGNTMYHVFGKDSCTYCDQTINLLTMKGLPFTYAKIGKDISSQAFFKMFEDGGLPLPRTAPQVFLNDEYVGGFIDLKLSLETIS